MEERIPNVENIEDSGEPNSSDENKKKIKLTEHVVAENQRKLIVVQAVVYQPCSPAPSTSQDDRVSVTPARVTEAERLRNYRAKKKKQQLQNNPDAILTPSPAPLTNAERAKNYRERQKQKQLGNNLDEIVASSPARVTEAERLRNYRAKKKEQQLQINPDAILTPSPAPLTNAVRAKNYRERQKLNLETESNNFNIADYLEVNLDNNLDTTDDNGSQDSLTSENNSFNRIPSTNDYDYDDVKSWSYPDYGRLKRTHQRNLRSLEISPVVSDIIPCHFLACYFIS